MLHLPGMMFNGGEQLTVSNSRYTVSEYRIEVGQIIILIPHRLNLALVYDPACQLPVG